MKLFLSISLAACAADEPAASVESQAATCTLNNGSLIETNPLIINDTSFSLHHVLDRIRLTTPSGVAIPSSALPMFQELYAAFADCTSSATIDPNHYGLSCRSAEASFATLDPFSGTGTNPLHYKPVALTNRIDLAPADFSYCGESRIVFWKDSGPPGRAAIIIELKTPAAVVSGAKTCAPVVAFWANLSTVTDTATRAQLLTDFYFKGIAGTPASPVKLPVPPVSANGAGFNGAGQVRLNSFVSFAQWNLREFKWKKVCTTDASGVTTCAAHFLEQTVKSDPSQLLFAGTHANAPSFQKWFVSTAVPRLATATTLSQIALGNANSYNTFESVSQPFPGDPTSVLYDSAASTTLRTQIGNQLALLGSSLSVDDILLRATTQTCGGCHQVSNFASLGGGLTWPASNGFTQIDENATLAPALQNAFLPFRLQVLEALACPGPTASGAAPGDGSLTVSGLPVGAAN